MNRRVRNIVTSLIAAFALSLAMPFGGLVSYAASAKISFSDPSTTVGQEFNVTVKVTATDGNLGASDLVLSYDQAYIESVSYTHLDVYKRQEEDMWMILSKQARQENA